MGSLGNLFIASSPDGCVCAHASTRSGRRMGGDRTTVGQLRSQDGVDVIFLSSE